MDADQRDMLLELNRAGVEYVLVGGQAVNAYGIPRYTKDLDIFIRPSIENGQAVYSALVFFGAPLDDISQQDLSDGKTVVQVGVEPNRVDLVQAIGGLSFDQVWEHRVVAEVDRDLLAPLISLDDLIVNKRFVGRPQDLADAAQLERVRRSSGNKGLPD